MWNPQHITVTIGDTVNWSWTGSTFGPMRNVAQVVMCVQLICRLIIYNIAIDLSTQLATKSSITDSGTQKSCK